jgi:hypothetical protein
MAARRAWAQALRIFEEIGHPDAWRIRARLRAAPPARRRAAAPARD